MQYIVCEAAPENCLSASAGAEYTDLLSTRNLSLVEHDLCVYIDMLFSFGSPIQDDGFNLTGPSIH